MNVNSRALTSPDDARAALVERLRSRLPMLSEAVLAHVKNAVADAAGDTDAQFVAGMREVVTACVECGLMAIERGEEWPGPVPPIVAVQARRAAHNGVSLTTGLYRYVTGTMLVWDAILAEVGADDISEVHKMTLLKSASVATLSLLARVITEATEAHLAELNCAGQTPRQRRFELVRRLLAGEFVDISKLDYDFEAEHVGLVAFGTEAQKAIEVLAERCGRRLLLVSPEDGTIWAWLGAQKPRTSIEIKRHLPEAAFPDVRLAVGEAEHSLAGFRLTHRLAQLAAMVAERRPQQVTRYADVALEAHALLDHTHARALVAAYLLQLQVAQDADTLLATLRAFYKVGRNESKTALLLGVGRQTVIRRLRRVEKLIGRPLKTCHAEVEVALRVDQLVAPQTSRSKPTSRTLSELSENFWSRAGVM